MTHARRRQRQGADRRQRGWAGLIVLLIALAIGAFIAKDAFKRYGLLSGTGTPAKASSPAQRQQSTIDALPSDASSAPSTALERARGVEETIKTQAGEQAKRMP